MFGLEIENEKLVKRIENLEACLQTGVFEVELTKKESK
jgi:hypothetical protein